jgi:hypothetical protein
LSEYHEVSGERTDMDGWAVAIRGQQRIVGWRAW